MTEDVLIDSSAWIDFFNEDGEHPVAAEVQRVIEDGRAFITEPVFIEVSVGITGKRELNRWKEAFAELNHAPVDQDVWLRALEVGQAIARQGLRVPLADLLLGTLALDRGLSILHSGDRHFPSMAGILGISEYAPAR